MSSNPHHDLIFTSSADGPITSYNSSTGATINCLAASRCPTRGLTIIGRTFLAAAHVYPETASGSIRLYNEWSSAAFHNLPLPEPVAPLATAPGGSYLFAGGLSGRVYVVSVPSGDILRSFSEHSGAVSCLGISDDGSLLISGGGDGTIVVTPIFELMALENKGTDMPLLHKFAAHSGAVTAVTTGKGLCNSQIISASSDRTLKFWSLLRGTHLRTIEFPCPILGFVLSPEESELYAAGSDGWVYKGWVLVQSPAMRLSQSHNGSVVSVGMVNNGQHLVSASEDGSVWIRSSIDGRVVLVLETKTSCGVSDLVVANGTSSVRVFGPRLSGGVRFFGDREFIDTRVKETMEIEGVLATAEKDRVRAIEMLESATAMYERLLKLILKESQRNTRHK